MAGKKLMPDSMETAISRDALQRAAMETENREFETRDAESRHLEIMKNIEGYGIQNEFHIPPEIVPEGMEYMYGRASYGYGIEDTSRLATLESQGWQPVPARRHQHLANNNHVIKRGNEERAVIMKKGLMLMERPKFYGDHHRKIMEERHHKIMLSMQSLHNAFNANPNIPGHFTKNETSWGRSINMGYKANSYATYGPGVYGS